MVCRMAGGACEFIGASGATETFRADYGNWIDAYFHDGEAVGVRFDELLSDWKVYDEEYNPNLTPKILDEFKNKKI